MSIVIEDSFSITAPADATFALMSDVERMCPCIPGAELRTVRDDGSYEVSVGMKIGPMMMSYLGSVAIDEADAATRTATLHARAKEQRGSGTAQATMTMQVEQAAADASVVTVHSEMLVTGRVAQMGRGIINDVASRMITDMARAVEQTLIDESAAASAPVPETPRAALAAGPPPAVARSPPQPPRSSVNARPPQAGRLLWLVVAERARRLVRRLRRVVRAAGR